MCKLPDEEAEEDDDNDLDDTEGDDMAAGPQPAHLGNQMKFWKVR